MHLDAVEPPSWWRGKTRKTLRLLLRGKGLTDESLSIDGDGLRLSEPRPSADGRYLFVTLEIAPNAAPGPKTLRCGEARATFTVLEKPAPRLGGLEKSDVLYLIMPDRFCDGDTKNNEPKGAEGIYDPRRPRHYHGGDLAGIQQKLPYLKELGVSALWLTPIYKNAPRAHPTLSYKGEPAIDYHGYCAIDFYAVEPHFGSEKDLHGLIAAAHAAGIKIMQDQVANHCGPLHPWAQNPPTPTWLHPKTDCDWNMKNAVNPYASPESKRGTLQGWFAGLLPDLNQDDPECRTYLIQNALWWVGVFGFDSIRQDTVPYVAQDFWQSWHAALRAEFPEISTLGEVNLPDPLVNAVFQRPPASFSHLYDFALFATATKAFASGGPLTPLVDALAADTVYPDPARLVTFLGLHDEIRFLTRPGASIERLKLAATFLFTMRGTPLWYYGDEIALEGGEDPDNRRSFPKGKFSPQGRTPEESGLFEHVKSLMHQRRRSKALQRGDLRILHARGQQLVYRRTHKNESVLVALNNSARPAKLTVEGKEIRLEPLSALVEESS